MASYLIYLPGKSGASVDLLREVGLDDLCADGAPLFVDIPSQGPDGGRGVLCGWDDPLDPSKNQPLAVRMDLQDWSPAKPHDGLAEGRFWLGRLKASHVRPRDIQRRKVYTSTAVRLSDGNDWLMPIVRALPSEVGFYNGDFCEHVQDEYEDFCRAADDIHSQLMEVAGHHLELRGGWEFGVRALSMNYRVNADIVDWLRLTKREHYLDFVGGPLELHVVREVDTQKKTVDAVTLAI